jgi:hypothetical protein
MFWTDKTLAVCLWYFPCAHIKEILKSWLSLRLSISWLVIKGHVISILSLHFAAMLIHSVFKISSLYELNPRSLYRNLILRDGRTQVEITLCDVGEAAGLFYMCYVCHFTTYNILVTTLQGSFTAVFSVTFVHCSCLFPNRKVSVSQSVQYWRYSPCVSVCNTFPKQKPANKCFKSLFLKRNMKQED